MWIEEGGFELICCIACRISGCSGRHIIQVRKELDGASDSFCPGLWNIAPVAPVVFWRATDIPAINSVRVPGFAYGRCFVDDDPCPWGSKRGTVVIELAIKYGFC